MAVIEILSLQHIVVNGIVVTQAPHPNLKWATLLRCKKWNEFVDQYTFSPRQMVSFYIRDVFMFGPNIGFICGEGTMEDDPRKQFVFIRGDAVSVLMVVSVGWFEHYLVFVDQYRFPANKCVLETICGMKDEDGKLVGVAVKEVEEETGIVIDDTKLVELGVTNPSVGGTFEKIYHYLYFEKMTRAQMEEKRSKVFGCAAEGEFTSVVFVSVYQYLWELRNPAFEDGKIQGAVLLCLSKCLTGGWRAKFWLFVGSIVCSGSVLCAMAVMCDWMTAMGASGWVVAGFVWVSLAFAACF